MSDENNEVNTMNERRTEDSSSYGQYNNTYEGNSASGNEIFKKLAFFIVCVVVMIVLKFTLGM